MAVRFKQKKTYQLVLSICSVLSINNTVLADEALDLGKVGTSSSVSSGTSTKKVSAKKLRDLSNSDKDPASAIYQAPTQASLVATEPQTIINQHYIQENVSGAANYTDIISIAPSVYSVDPNGSGLMENQSLSIRGLKDGQFNVTFDGIPFADSNDFTHHTTSYFMSQDVGKITVDRGPGDASTIGNATFGGTIAVESKSLEAKQSTKFNGSLGSWGTRLLGAEYNSGVLQDMGDARAFISAKDLTSDGYLTGNNIHRQNVFAKIEKPVGDETLITFGFMYNRLHQNVSGGGGFGATLAQMQQYGKNFSLSSDPSSQNYSGYNFDQIHTDIEYIDLKTNLIGWQIDNKIYTYAYYHNGANTISPPDTTNNSLVNNATYGAGGIANANDVSGQKMYMNYRSYGDNLKLSKEFGPGELNTGLWIDYQWNDRGQYEVDWTTGGTRNLLAGAGGAGATDRQMHDTLTSIQPYLEYVWKPTESWSITSGVKYAYFKREVNADVLQSTLLPYNGSGSWGKALPSLNIRYAVNNNWSIYSQYAQGFLAPNLNLLYKKNVQPNTINPETTQNYQLGTTWASQEFTLGFDVYQIDFTNLINGVQTGANTYVYNSIGGVKYNGFEAEGTWHIGNGFNLYGNYSYNHYKTSDGSILQNTPQNMASLGLIYEEGPVYASIISKETGARYSDGSGNTTTSAARLGAYNVTNLAISYKLEPSNIYKEAKIGLQINNLFNGHNLIASMATDINGNPTYYALPERNAMVNLTLGY